MTGFVLQGHIKDCMGAEGVGQLLFISGVMNSYNFM